MVSYQGATLGTMKRVELYKWKLASRTTGRRIVAKNLMSREEALARDPTAERIGPPTVIEVAETEEERWKALNQRGDR